MRAIDMNIRDEFLMWRPSKGAPKVQFKEDYSESSSGSSSSSSSSSSSDSVDDEETIDIIRQDLEPHSQGEVSEFFEKHRKINFDYQIYEINRVIKNRIKARRMKETDGKKSDDSDTSSEESSSEQSDDSISNQEQKDDQLKTSNDSMNSSDPKNANRVRSRSRDNDTHYSGGSPEVTSKKRMKKRWDWVNN